MRLPPILSLLLTVFLPVFGGAAERPNILFIIIDDLNDSVEGFGGHPQAVTPNIDRLAERGVRFLNAASNAPICASSRPSMLTGLYPHTTRFFGNPEDSIGANGHYKFAWKHAVFQQAKTWMQHFRAHGYDVYGAGKIDHNYAERWSDWHVDGELVYGPKPSWGPFPYKGSGIRPNGSTDMNFALAAPHPAMPEIRMLDFFVPLTDVPTTPPNPATGFEGYTGWFMYNAPYRYVSETDRDPMPDELLAEFAEVFFAERADSGETKPFFLNIGINRPHAPLVAPQKYYDLFPLDEVQLAPRLEGDLEDCAPFLWKDFDEDAVSTTGGFGRYQLKVRLGLMKQWTQGYLACVAFADDMVGRILRALENSPYADNTLVVLTSDHGYHMGEKDYNFKFSVWEEAARIPMVVAGPGVAQGENCAAPVSLVDLYPTFIDITGVPGNPHPHLPLDGHSLRPLLSEPLKGQWTGPEVALTAIVGRDRTDDEAIPATVGTIEGQSYSVRSERHRYTICPDGSAELYDHDKDPNEWVNLIEDPAYAAIRKELHAHAEALTETSLGRFFRENSYERMP